MIRLAEPQPPDDEQFEYDGRDFDANTVQYYKPARWYDPTVGGWLNEEPIAFADDVNFYRYVGSAASALPQNRLLFGDRA